MGVLISTPLKFNVDIKNTHIRKEIYIWKKPSCLVSILDFGGVVFLWLDILWVWQGKKLLGFGENWADRGEFFDALKLDIEKDLKPF